MDVTAKSVSQEFETTGRVWFRNALNRADLALITELLGTGKQQNERLDLQSDVGRFLASNINLQRCFKELRPNCRPVRAVLFNKSSDRNWSIGWHQDRVISVAEKCAVEGFDNWTKKSGRWHCEPPLSVLDEMLFVRIHLDDCDEDNGPMEIVLGSHKSGIISSLDCAKDVAKNSVEACKARAGDVLVLKMLTLHRSRPSNNNGLRRVIRVDYSAQDLPIPLSWG